MDFKVIRNWEKEDEKVIYLDTETDFKKFAEKTENKDYLFISYMLLRDENGKQIKALERKIVFDKESNSFFGFAKKLIPDERFYKLHELEQIRGEEIIEETPEFSEILESIGIKKEKFTELIKEYLTENKISETNFFNETFEKSLAKKSKQIKNLLQKNVFEVRDYVYELTSEKEIQEIIAKNKLQELQEKNKLYEEIAKEINEKKEYENANKEALKKAIIKEHLYKKGIIEFTTEDILRIKNQIEILQINKKN